MSNVLKMEWFRFIKSKYIYVILIVLSNMMQTGSLGELVKYLICYYILLSSVAVIMSCFVQVIGNQVIAIIIGLVYGSGIIYDIIDFILNTLGLEAFSIKNYLPIGILCNLSFHEQSTYFRNVLIALLFGINFVLTNVIVKNKQDIGT